VLLQLAIDDGGRACAQIYHFEAERVPRNKSLVVKKLYFVYNHKDAPENRFGNAFVQFHNLGIAGAGNQPTDYRGVQVSLLKANHFQTLINPEHFCCRRDDVKKGICGAEAQDQLLWRKPEEQNHDGESVYIHTVQSHQSDLGAKRDAKMTIRDTGAYMLAVSNCGQFTDARISGKVVVKSPYGFLPGSDYPKLRLYEWLSIAYMAIGLVWMVFSVRYFKELLSIHSCIGCVILLGLIESFLQCWFLSDWNSSGVRSNPLFFLAAVAGVAKSTFSYVILLITSLGWGVTRPHLDKDTSKTIEYACIAYIFFSILREAFEEHTHSQWSTLPFLLLTFLPASMLSGFIFYWILSALSSLIESFQDRKQMEKLLLFKRFYWTIVVACGVAVVASFAECVHLSNPTDKWMNQWKYTDGVFDVLFVLVLVVMMFLWAPHKQGQSVDYTPYAQVAHDEAKATDGGPTSATPKGGSSEWVDEQACAYEGDGDSDDARRPASTSQPKPTQIGSGTSSGSVLKDTMRELERLGAGDEAPSPESKFTC